MKQQRLLATLSVASLVVGLGPHSIASTKSAKSPAPKNTSTPHKETAAERLKKSAPADEYFGRLKMSYIGINNTLHDEAIRAGDYTTSTDIIHTMTLTEDALKDWRKKYPNDPQLARTFFLMGKMYAKIWTAPGQSSAAYYYHQLESQFGHSYFGKLLHTQLAKGFTEHILADAVPCPAPLATATAIEPLRRGQTPSPSPSPTDTPSPSPTPSATPTPPSDSRIKVSIVAQPCFTPTPAPTPTPTPSPVPTGSVAPVPSGSASPLPSTSPSPPLPPIHTMIPATPTPLPSGRVTPTPSPHAKH